MRKTLPRGVDGWDTGTDEHMTGSAAVATNAFEAQTIVASETGPSLGRVSG